jgi:2-keto-3-deoxy-6-phosphogluconate aldolase
MTEPVSWPTVKHPLIAILRGIRPDEAESIVEAPIDNGFELIEVLFRGHQRQESMPICVPPLPLNPFVEGMRVERTGNGMSRTRAQH